MITDRKPLCKYKEIALGSMRVRICMACLGEVP